LNRHDRDQHEPYTRIAGLGCELVAGIKEHQRVIADIVDGQRPTAWGTSPRGKSRRSSGVRRAGRRAFRSRLLRSMPRYFPGSAGSIPLIQRKNLVLLDIARNRAWPSTGSWSCAIALILNPVNSHPEPSICDLAPCAGSHTKRPTAVFSAPIWLPVFVASKG